MRATKTGGWLAGGEGRESKTANRNAVHRRLGEALASTVTLRRAVDSATAMQVTRIGFAALVRLPWSLSDVPLAPNVVPCFA
jgi:hypothetical protein